MGGLCGLSVHAMIAWRCGLVVVSRNVYVFYYDDGTPFSFVVLVLYWMADAMQECR